jgi:predicted DNA binding protein
MGYYSTPRRTSQRELADRLNIRQATVAEHLQRAERDLIKHWIEQNTL